MSEIQMAPVRRAMKTRDIIKYAFASLLGLLTIAAIAGLTYSKAQRRAVTEAELKRIEQTVGVFGDHGQIPAKSEPSTDPQPTVSR